MSTLKADNINTYCVVFGGKIYITQRALEVNTMIKGLPEKLQELRAKYSYSQKQVADLIKVSPSVVSGYETGERTPSTDVLLQLANIYKCSTDYLLGKDSTQPPVILDTSGLTDAQIQAIQNLIISIREKR